MRDRHLDVLLYGLASHADPATAAAGAIDAAASGPLGDLVLDEARTRLGLPPAGVRRRPWE